MTGTENNKSALVGGVAWLFILLGGWHAARAAYDNFTLAEMFSSPGFMLGLAGSTLPVQLPPLARLAVEHIQSFFALYLLVSLTVCVSGVGLLRRKAWARTAAVRYFYIASAAGLALFILPELLVPEPYLFEGRSLTPGFNDLTGQLRFQTRILAACLCACAVWLARRLDRAEIRKEFGTKIP